MGGSDEAGKGRIVERAVGRMRGTRACVARTRVTGVYVLGKGGGGEDRIISGRTARNRSVPESAKSVVFTEPERTPQGWCSVGGVWHTPLPLYRRTREISVLIRTVDARLRTNSIFLRAPEKAVLDTVVGPGQSAI